MAQCMHPATAKTKTGNYVPVPCGKCPACLKNRARALIFRHEEYLNHEAKNGFFLTLTYAPEHYPADGNLSKKDLQLFQDRLRKKSDRDPSKPKDWPQIKYADVGEYGTKTGRAHYHALEYNLIPKLQDPETLSKIWGLGFVVIKKANPNTINYTLKYILKSWNDDTKQKPFLIQSNGIGLSYVKRASQMHKDNLQSYIRTIDGYKMKMPDYIRNKIFTEEELEIIKEQNLEHALIRELNEPVIYPNGETYVDRERRINEYKSYLNSIEVNKRNKL